MYESSKIYKVVCSVDNFSYYGATTLPLAQCLANLRGDDLKNNQYQKLKNCGETHGWDKLKIVLLEDYPCSSRKELNARLKEHRNGTVRPHVCDECTNRYRKYVDVYFSENGIKNLVGTFTSLQKAFDWLQQNDKRFAGVSYQSLSLYARGEHAPHKVKGISVVRAPDVFKVIKSNSDLIDQSSQLMTAIMRYKSAKI